MHDVELINILASLIFAVGMLGLSRAPSCVDCSGKFRHRPDCRSQK